jgi:AcrR family transcriptional regulator
MGHSFHPKQVLMEGKLGRVTKPVKKRKYDASGRREAAEQTRLRVLHAARDLFAERGYAGTSVTAIARSAGVSVDTLYATIGRKPQLLLAVHDMELAGGGSPVAALEMGGADPPTGPLPRRRKRMSVAHVDAATPDGPCAIA